jgi:hypothetical protein
MNVMTFAAEGVKFKDILRHAHKDMQLFLTDCREWCEDFKIFEAVDGQHGQEHDEHDFYN